MDIDWDRWKGWEWEFGRFLRYRRLEVLRKTLSKCRYVNALDVGCGEGFLRLCGVDSIGIDLGHGCSASIIASAEQLPFRQGSFDLIFAGEILEHTNAPLRALSEWAAALKPGATIIISTPNGLLMSLDNPQHQHVISYRALNDALTSLGLRPVSKTGIFTGLVSGRRWLGKVTSERLKRILMRVPVPVSLSYDYFATFRKSHGSEESGAPN